jgi:hypothetical protein
MEGNTIHTRGRAGVQARTGSTVGCVRLPAETMAAAAAFTVSTLLCTARISLPRCISPARGDGSEMGSKLSEEEQSNGDSIRIREQSKTKSTVLTAIRAGRSSSPAAETDGSGGSPVGAAPGRPESSRPSSLPRPAIRIRPPREIQAWRRRESGRPAAGSGRDGGGKP